MRHVDIGTGAGGDEIPLFEQFVSGRQRVHARYRASQAIENIYGPAGLSEANRHAAAFPG